MAATPNQIRLRCRPHLRITKRGSKYLRKMLIQGARAALPTLKAADTPVGAWLRGLLARAHLNTAVVALAAKMARTVWALLRHGTLTRLPPWRPEIGSVGADERRPSMSVGGDKEMA